MEKTKYLDELKKIVKKTFLSVDHTKPLAIIVSGGIDSSTLYALAHSYFTHLQPFSLISSRSHDLPFIKLLEKRFQTTITLINADNYPPDYLKERLFFYQQQLPLIGIPTSPTHLAIAVGFDLLFAEIQKQGITQVLTAQGPDVLLGGYHRYQELKGKKLKEKIKTDLPSLEIDIKRDSFVASLHNLTLINPYLTTNFIKFSLQLPVSLIRSGDRNKYLLRLLGQDLSLPQEIVTRPKEAFQYSTRIQKILSRLQAPVSRVN